MLACILCSAVRGHDEGRFITLNPQGGDYTSPAEEIHFCSTECLKNFVGQPDNRGQIAWQDPAQLPGPDPEKRAFLKEVSNLPKAERGRLREDRDMFLKVHLAETGILMANIRKRGPGCKRCSPPDHMGWAQKAMPGPFLHVDGSEWGGEDADGKVLGIDLSGWYCSIDCLVTMLNNQPYDAKGWWTKPERPRCFHCQVVRRSNHESFAELNLTDGNGIFCSSACLLATLDTLPEDRIRKCKLIESADGCCACGRGHDAICMRNQDPEVETLFAQAEKLRQRRQRILDATSVPDPSFTIVVSQTLDDPAPVHRYVETDETRALKQEEHGIRSRAYALYHDRNPILDELFIPMYSGYGPPVDGGAVFCSVACIRSLFGNESWRDWDAKKPEWGDLEV